VWKRDGSEFFFVKCDQKLEKVKTMKSRNVLLVALLLFLVGSLSAQKPIYKGGRSHLDLKISPVFDLYYFLRKHAEDNSNPESNITGFEEAVNATRQLQKDFGGAITPIWSLLDAHLVNCKNTLDVVRLFSELPETIKFRGKEHPVREGAIRLAKAMNAMEPQFHKSEWRLHKKTIQKAASNITRTLKPKEKESIAYMLKHLDLPEPQKPISIYLVAESPSPGAFTFFLKDGGTLVVINVKNEGSLLYESVLHEVIHVLEGMPGRETATESFAKKSVFTELSERLHMAGVSERDSGFAGHLLVFAQAAATVKKFLDPNHKPYGEVQTVYARLSHISPFVVPTWNQYLEGTISRDQALTQIVDGITKKEREK
jgi:hypothetical protein